MVGLLNQTITHYPKSSLDGYGRPAWGTAADYRCRVELKERRRMQPDGSTIVTEGLVFLANDPGIDTADKLVYNSRTYKVFARKENTDGTGNLHHLTLEIQKWPEA